MLGTAWTVIQAAIRRRRASRLAHGCAADDVFAYVSDQREGEDRCCLKRDSRCHATSPVVDG
jgi:hypothetical protein